MRVTLQLYRLILAILPHYRDSSDFVNRTAVS